MKNLIINNIQRYIAIIFMTCIALLSCESDDTRIPLIIKSINVTEGFFGDEIIIEGTGFSPVAADNLVTFGGLTAEVLNATSTSITAKVPFPAPTGKITVTTNNEEAPGPIFTIVLPPSTIIAFTSFEEVPTFVGDITYPKSGTEDLPNIQLSNPDADDPYVDFTATGDELGFDSSFISSDIGDSGSERMGVFINENLDTAPDDFSGRFQDGNQGFITSDLDGTIEVVFDQTELDASNTVAVTIDAAIYFEESNYEEGDGINIYYKVGDVLGSPIISYEFNDITKSQWINASGVVPVDQVTQGNIVVRMKNGANSEMIYIDNIILKGVKVNQ